MPFRALRPAPGHAADVLAPPYDVLSTDEARVRAPGKPWSFLHISRPEIDLPGGTDPYDGASMPRQPRTSPSCRGGVLVRDPPTLLLRLPTDMGDHIQTGLAVAASLADYDSNRIRRHEFTTPDKEDDRVRQIEAVNAQTGPVLLAYPDRAAVDAHAGHLQPSGKPEVDVTADDGVRHTIWAVQDRGVIASSRGLRCHAGALHRRRASPLGRGRRTPPTSAQGAGCNSHSSP